MNDAWTVQILVAEDATRGVLGMDPARGSHVVRASVAALRAQWQETIRTLTAIGDGIDEPGSGWGVSQIEVGLTLNAKGQPLFIAEAGAEASVKVTLTRRAS